ncbi:hypothetical protein [Pedobacter sp. KACC 23697]|uniref:LPXTG cell wall anchor domain-containing protein n=1 Tax=Pedobacter sp. KACC 23697 TaxID=3149230 RepID=A0AAU7K7B3_9SPHI
MKSFCLLVLIFLTYECSFAQGSASGCFIPYYNRVYTSNALEVLGSSQLFNNSPSVGLSTNYCSWTPSATASSCVICDGTLGLDVLGARVCLLGSFRYGSAGTFTMVECDLDDHTWLFGAAAGLFGILIIRKRNKL